MDKLAVARLLAPVIIQDEVAGYDRVGRLFWDGDRLAVDGDDPVVYFYITHGIVKGTSFLQVNYVFWYQERTGPNAPLLEHGHIDGLTVRLSVWKDGWGCTKVA